MKTLLFISDKDEKFNHSFIEGVVNGYLRRYFDVKCVYFGDKESKNGDKITLLKSNRKKAFNILKDKFIDFKNIDFVIVRNFLDILRGGVKFKREFGFRLYFQLSFPHFYRSYYEAKICGKKVLFKFIKYKINHILYANLIKQCDGFFPISNLMKKDFFPNIKTPFLPLPLGIEKNNICIKRADENENLVKFIYIGAVDINRNLKFFLSEFAKSKSKFEFAIYTKDVNYTMDVLPKDSRFKLFKAVEKDEIFKIMQNFDIGCFYVPINKLYNCASPTKVMDYYSCGLVAFSSKVAECVELFDGNSAFFIDDENIALRVDKICALNKDKFRQMAQNGLENLIEKRDYEKIAFEIYNFLEKK